LDKKATALLSKIVSRSPQHMGSRYILLKKAIAFFNKTLELTNNIIHLFH